MRKAHSLLPHFALLAILLLPALLSCKPKRPAGILSPSQMERLLVDYHLAQGMAEAQNDAANADALRYTYIRAALRKHHIEEAVFDSSMIYYSAHSEQMALICARVCEKVEAMRGSSGNSNGEYDHSSKYAHLTQQGDTANVWNGIQHATLTSDVLHNLLMITWEADTATRAGDKFIWHCNSQKVAPGNLPDAFAQLIIRYENDTVVSTTSRVYGERDVEMHWQPTSKLDTLRPVSVTAMVYLSSREVQEKEKQGRNVPEVLLLRNISLIRIHPKPKENVQKNDTVQLKTDSIDAQVDTTDLQPESMEEERKELPRPRISPAQLREAHPHTNTINIQKAPSARPLKPNRTLRPAREIKR